MMKELSLNRIDHYMKLIKRFNKKYKISYWDDTDTSSFNIECKLAYLTITKILQELGISKKHYSMTMPVFDLKVLDDIRDYNWDLEELNNNLVQNIYSLCGWDINIYVLGNIYEEFEYKDSIDSFSTEEENLIMDFLGSNYNQFHEMIKEFIEYNKSEILCINSLYVYRNRRLGKYMSYIKNHPAYKKSEIGSRINKILKRDINPCQFRIPPHYISNCIDDEGNYILSYYFFDSYNSTEYISALHIQPDRVILALLLDQLLDMAYKELNLREDAA